MDLCARRKTERGLGLSALAQLNDRRVGGALGAPEAPAPSLPCPIHNDAPAKSSASELNSFLGAPAQVTTSGSGRATGGPACEEEDGKGSGSGTECEEENGKESEGES